MYRRLHHAFPTDPVKTTHDILVQTGQSHQLLHSDNGTSRPAIVSHPLSEDGGLDSPVDSRTSTPRTRNRPPAANPLAAANELPISQQEALAALKVICCVANRGQ